jgi:hypothetical protein
MTNAQIQSTAPERHGAYFEIQPERDSALDAFYHPYAHR